VTYFYAHNLSRQPSINLFVFYIKNSVITSLKNKIFKEMFKTSSAAAQRASTKAAITQAQLLDPTQPTKN